MQKTVNCLSDTESRKLMDYAGSALAGFPFNHLLVTRVCLCVLLHETGLRIGESVQLRWSDFFTGQYQDNALIVRDEIAKNNVERVIPLSLSAKYAIATHYTNRITDVNYDINQWVFRGQDPRKHISIRHARNIVRTITGIAISRSVHPHVLRHTFATRLMRVANARVVQQLLGHSSLESTQIYCHPNDQDLRSAIDKSCSLNETT